MTKKIYPALLMLALGCVAYSQPKPYSSSEVYQKLKKLNVLGTVLYVAAHPDDENTSVISYLSNGELYRTAYLAATRGDGGQNLIGPEIREQLGIIRTQELLAARRTDGAQQFFSRANDFGYSKNSEETFNLWDKEEILADFVWVFRKFRPDVIITRFDDQPPNHGHHTASAILAREAFKLAADERAFADQLKYVEPWQPERIYWNTHPFFFTRRGEKFDTASYGQIPIGKYNPVLGKSYTEISALSRSMHKSQGFGSTGSRGERNDFLTQWEGSESLQPFEGIDTSWERVAGGKKVKPVIDGLLQKFDPSDPSSIYSDLLAVKAAIADHIQDDFWKKIKIKEVDDLIQAVTGLYVEIRANDYAFTPGDSIELTLEVVNRSGVGIDLKSINIQGLDIHEEVKIDLQENVRVNKILKAKIPLNMKYSNPYWLESEGPLGRYRVAEQLFRGLPENLPIFTSLLEFGLKEDGKSTRLEMNLPVVFKRNDPVDGEVHRPLVIQPPVMANVESASLIFSNAEIKQVQVRVIAGRDEVKGNLKLNLPDGWEASPSDKEISLKIKGEEQVFEFDITPPTGSSEGVVEAIITIDGSVFNQGKVVIEYDHIPTQTLFPKSSTRVVKLDLKKEGNSIGYIVGAGDDLPNNLSQIGYEVIFLEKDDVIAANLAQYDAVILGVRAFNTIDWLSYKNTELFEYVKNGGNVIVQFNTSHRLVTQDIAPFPLKLSRDRVAVEEAEVRMLAKKHDAVNKPNKISDEDFDNWVQERGLYFPNEWSEEFTPILSSNDPGEDPRNGGLLVAKYGEGYYVYSGYSWFRQLPAGVSGAYRLFANLISLGK